MKSTASLVLITNFVLLLHSNTASCPQLTPLLSLGSYSALPVFILPLCVNITLALTLRLVEMITIMTIINFFDIYVHHCVLLLCSNTAASCLQRAPLLFVQQIYVITALVISLEKFVIYALVIYLCRLVFVSTPVYVMQFCFCCFLFSRMHTLCNVEMECFSLQ